jgi:hypothetical protein
MMAELRETRNASRTIQRNRVLARVLLILHLGFDDGGLNFFAVTLKLRAVSPVQRISAPAD